MHIFVVVIAIIQSLDIAAVCGLLARINKIIWVAIPIAVLVCIPTRRDIFVDGAVTIVVFAITRLFVHFVIWTILTRPTRRPRTILTALGFVSGAYTDPLTTKLNSSQVVIDLAIAIVIFAIARFCLRRSCVDRASHARPIVFTDICTRLLTRSLPDRTSLSLVGKVFVNGTITIVVFVIT